MSSATLPSSLAHIKPYILRAEELHGINPLSGHALRHFAMTVGIKTKSEDARAFLLLMMDLLEEERQILDPRTPDTLEALRSLAVSLIERANFSDKPEIQPSATDEWTNTHASQVARAFHAAAVLIDAMRLYTVLDPALKSAQKYALLRSVELAVKLSRALVAEPCIPVDWMPAKADLLPPPPKPSSPKKPPPAAAASSPPPAPP